MKIDFLFLILASVASLATAQPLPDAGSPTPMVESAAALRDRKLEDLIGSTLRRGGFATPVTSAKPDMGPSTAKKRPLSQEPFDDADTYMVSGVIIRFRDPSIQVMAAHNEPPPDDVIVAVREASQTPISFHRAMSGGMHVFRFAEPAALSVAESIVQRLRNLPIIEHVEADVIARQQAVSTDPYYLSNQWNLLGPTQGYAGGIEANMAWGYTTGSAGTIVAVVDSGVLPNPEFASRLLPGYDFVSAPENSNDGDGRDSDATDPGDYAAAGECGSGSPARNSSWHGTHVAGIIAADGANGIGIAGVSWRSRILPVRVLGKCGSGSISDILDGIHWAAGRSVPGVPPNPNPAHVINLSLGGYSPSGCTRAYQEAINEAVGQGVLVVVAAGNSSQDAARYTPASCHNILTVMAVDPFGELASYSNYSFTGHIAAPGGDMSRYGDAGGILSTVDTGTRDRRNPTWKPLHGTSMAAPHVSGVAALALSINPNLAGAELIFLLQFASNPFPTNSYCAVYGICGSGVASAMGGIGAAALFSDFTLVYEFYNVDLDHYFRTGGKTEAAMINRGSAGLGWYDTFDYFYAWRSPTGGALPVCRFYGTPGVGPNSHFYTASAAECEMVKRDPGWTYEGIAFYAKLPTGGACQPGERPVYRAYNNRWMHNDSNHRYTTDPGAYSRLVASGWAGEGVALCGI